MSAPRDVLDAMRKRDYVPPPTPPRRPGCNPPPPAAAKPPPPPNPPSAKPPTNRQRIVEYIKAHPGAAAKQITEAVGLKYKCDPELKVLCEGGVIRRVKTVGGGSAWYPAGESPPAASRLPDYPLAAYGRSIAFSADEIGVPARSSPAAAGVDPIAAIDCAFASLRGRLQVAPRELEHCARRVAVLRQLAELLDTSIAIELVAVADFLADGGRAAP